MKECFLRNYLYVTNFFFFPKYQLTKQTKLNYI